MTTTMTELPDLPCRDIVEVVTAYLEGALPEDLHARFEYHLSTCDKCVDYVEQIRRTVAITGEAIEPERLPPELREGVREVFGDWSASPHDTP